jgi:5-carboxymethyl-2-hydroxymuconate isomerase
MPHLVLLHTKNMETRADLDGLCRRLGGVMVGARDADGNSQASRAHLSALFDARYFGMTLHIDEGAEMCAQSHSSIHPLFASA